MRRRPGERRRQRRAGTARGGGEADAVWGELPGPVVRAIGYIYFVCLMIQFALPEEEEEASHSRFIASRAASPVLWARTWRFGKASKGGRRRGRVRGRRRARAAAAALSRSKEKKGLVTVAEAARALKRRLRGAHYWWRHSFIAFMSVRQTQITEIRRPLQQSANALT